MQAIGRPLAWIPRFFWTLLAFVIYTIAGVAGREHFSDILTNFLSILSYWTAFFIVVVAEEHFIFRRPGGTLGGYNLDDYDTPSRLPLGIAGVLAGCFGVAGAVVGMAQVWYIGPIARHIGVFGADLGFDILVSTQGAVGCKVSLLSTPVATILSLSPIPLLWCYRFSRSGGAETAGTGGKMVGAWVRS